MLNLLLDSYLQAGLVQFAFCVALDLGPCPGLEYKGRQRILGLLLGMCLLFLVRNQML